MSSLQETIQKHEKIIGTIGAGLAIIMFGSLIEVLNSNLSGKSDIFIQPLATAISGLVWSLYAFGKKDMFILIPNLLALFLGVITAFSAAW